MKKLTLATCPPATTVRLPRIALTSPFFTLESNPEGREITVKEDDHIVTYQVGMDPSHRRGSFTVEDAGVLVSLLALPCNEGLVNFDGLGDLGRWTYDKVYNIRRAHQLVCCLGHLRSTSIVRRVPGLPEAPIFTIISDWDLAQFSKSGDWKAWDSEEKTAGHFRGTWIAFSQAFMAWLNRAIDVDVAQFLKLKSRMARALFLYLPSRAFPLHRFDAVRPQRMDISDVLTDLGVTPPKALADRLRFFVRSARDLDIAKELNGAKVSRGNFRCEIKLRDDGTDYEIIFWIEPGKGLFNEQDLLPFARPTEIKGKLQMEFMAGGGTAEEWIRMVNSSMIEKRVADEIDELLKSGVFTRKDSERNADSVRMAFKVLGDHGMHDAREFVAKLLKEQLVGGTKVRNPAATWMSRVKLAMKNAGLVASRRRAKPSTVEPQR